MDDHETKQLIQKAREGDTRAFEALVNESYGIMFKMALKWCGNKSDAEDITQDACIKLARGIGSFKGDSAFTSWLYRLVINCGKDWYKKQNRHPDGAGDDIIYASKNDQKEDRHYANQVIKAVYNLPEGEKDALLLVMHEGYTHKEAADILGCKEGTISSRIHEARKKLEAQFEKDEKYG